MNALRAALAGALAATPAFAVQPQRHRFEGAADFQRELVSLQKKEPTTRRRSP